MHVSRSCSCNIKTGISIHNKNSESYLYLFLLWVIDSSPCSSFYPETISVVGEIIAWQHALGASVYIYTHLLVFLERITSYYGNFHLQVEAHKL